MTDYPRFDPTKRSPDTGHRAYHGGCLVEGVLRAVDWWSGARNRPVLGQTTDAAEKCGSRTTAPLKVHLSADGLIIPRPNLSSNLQDLSGPDSATANANLKRAARVGLLAALLATGAFFVAAAVGAAKRSDEHPSTAGSRLSSGQSMQARRPVFGWIDHTAQ